MEPGRGSPGLFDSDLQPCVVCGEEVLAESKAGVLAVLRQILLVHQWIGALRVHRRNPADDDDAATVAAGVEVQAHPRMSPDVSDLGGVGLRVDDHILTVEVELHEPRDGWPDFATVVSTRTYRIRACWKPLD